MMETFEELGVSPVLLAGIEAVGWDAPSGLQRDAMAVVRRGNNIVMHASAGAGVVGAYGLPILDRVLNADDADDAGPRALILTADGHSASATARSLAQLAAPADVAVRALRPGWTADPAPILVATPTSALEAVRTSALKLDALLALVIDEADLMTDTGSWAALETLVDIVPADAQRVLVSAAMDDGLRSFAERHVRKALTVPKTGEAPSGGSATVEYAVVSEEGKAGAAVDLLGRFDSDQVAVVCRTFDRAETTRGELARRGAGTGSGAGTDDADAPHVLVLPRAEADTRSVQAGVLSADVPFDAAELRALHENGGVILVTPRERAHLLRIARRAGMTASSVALPQPARTAVDALRDRIRDLVREDLTVEMALLEPLLDEMGAPEIAAAALRLARTSPGAPAGAADAGAATVTPSAPPPTSGTWTHLFVSVGERDDIGPGDIVGAITGETGVSGDKVGKIDIRESHTTVEVATEVAAKIIEALNGRTLGGRSMRVDYDRKSQPSSGDRAGDGRGGSGRGAGGRDGSGRGGPGGGRGGPGRGSAARGGSGRGGGGRGGPDRGGPGGGRGGRREK